MKTLKVMIITNMISPYRIPLFNAISEQVYFKVVFLAEKEKNRKWQIFKDKIRFNYQVLPGWQLFIWGKKREIPIHINRNVLKTLWEYNPEVVITSGYDSLAYWQAFLYCKIFKKKFILWNGTTLLSAGSIKGIQGLLKRIIIKGADRYIAYGTKAKEYLEYLGAKPEKILISTNTVDMEYFRNKVFEYKNNESFVRERARYPRYLLLYVGQLIKRKGVIQVLKVLDYWQDPEIGLLIVGSGPQEEELKEFFKEKNLSNVFFEEFRQQDMLFKYYALSDIFILPSLEEVWGLVVNEALSSGLYVLSSKYAGASYDLIREEWNGETFDPNNIKEFATLIKQTKEQIEDTRKRRKAISQHACREFSIERSVKAFLETIEAVLQI